MVGEEQRGIHRSALGHDEGLGEHLEGADHAHDQVEENVGGEHGQRDVPELLPGASSIINFADA